jgi:hypothetical protein
MEKMWETRKKFQKMFKINVGKKSILKKLWETNKKGI